MSVRVMHVVLTLSPGGTERLVVELVRRLGAGVVAGVCCLDEPGAWAPQVETSGVAVDALHRSGGFRPRLAGRIAALARRHGATVLHCHHYSPFVYGSLAACLARRLPVVFTEHGRLSNAGVSRKRRLVNALLARLPAALCAVSEDLKRHMMAEGFPAGRIRVVHNGIEPGPPPSHDAHMAARRTLGLDPDCFVVGTVARLDPVKDLGTLVRGFSRTAARHSAAHLVIVGDGAERGALEGAARASGAGGRIHFTGARDDARALLAGFDVYVNSSTTEGVSVTILEAMAAGVPVVATRVGGTPEVVVHGETGLLVPAADPEALAGAIELIAESIEHARRMACRGRCRVESAFGLDRMAGQYLELYRLAAEGPF